MLNRKVIFCVTLLTLGVSGLAVGQSTTSRTKAKPKTSTAKTKGTSSARAQPKKPTPTPSTNNALPERGDEVLVPKVQEQTPQSLGNFEIQVLDRPANSPNTSARPFQTNAGDGQSIRRKQPTAPSVNVDRPMSDLAVENPNAQPTKNATTKPKQLIKQNPNETRGDKPRPKPQPDGSPKPQIAYEKIQLVNKDTTVNGRDPRSTETANGSQTSRTRQSSTQTQRPPNGPVGKPKRPDIKPIKREPIENPVKITPPSSEWDVDNPDEVTGRTRRPTQDKLGNFEIQRAPQSRDMEITMAQDSSTPAATRTETVNNNENGTRPANAPAQASAAAPTEEVRLEKAAKPKRKPTTRRTTRKPN